MTWLVTGGSGFLGRHILNALRDRQDRVVAMGRHHPGGWPIEDFVRADLDDLPSWSSAVKAISPDVVIHAAGKTPPAPSRSLYWANTRATAHLLESLRAIGRPCRVVLAGSAAELGAVPVAALPVSEDHPCRPIDAYGLSKWAATRLGMAECSSLKVITGRVFNPIGPGMPASQAFGRFAGMLCQPCPDAITLTVGNLSARRDFVDVRDVASALIMLAETGQAGQIYHVGTGTSHAVREGLDRLVAMSGRPVRVEESTMALCGPSDSRADIGRIVKDTAWCPRVPWEQSLADLWIDAQQRSLIRRVA